MEPASKTAQLRRMLVVAIAAIVPWWPGPAPAAIIRYAESFVLGPAGASGTTETGNLLGSSSAQTSVSLPRFDAALGTLQGVGLTLSSTWFHAGELRARDDVATITNFISCSIIPTILCEYANDTSIVAAIYAGLQVGLADPAATVPGLSTANIQGGSCLEDPDDPRVRGVACQYSLAQAGSFDASFDLSGSNLAAFVGSSPLQLLLTSQFIVSGVCDDDDRGDICTASNSLRWAGNLSATYDYAAAAPGDPTAVPEPGALALLGAGLLGVVLSRRASRVAG